MNRPLAPIPALRARSGPALPVARLVVGRSLEEVEALLPRLFALCRAAQGVALQAALGRAVDPAPIAAEVLRDHLMKLFVTWPRLLGLPVHALPEGWTEGRGVATALFGPTGTAPESAEDFAAFLRSGHGVAPLLSAIDRAFGTAGAIAPLPPVTPGTIWSDRPVENASATRQAHRPALAALPHGPLWRAAARAYDAESALTGALPAVTCPVPGTAVVPATRGSYGLRIATEEGFVTDFARITPTDHMLAPGGALDLSLAALPADRAGLAPLLLDILDPCAPVELVPTEVRHA